jgi:hypothetical protein
MKRFTLALVAGALMVGLFAVPAAGYTVKGTGLYARFAGGSTEGTGIFMVDRTGSSSPRLHGTFVGLLPYIEQDAVFRSIGCGGNPSAANRVFAVHGVADANGDLTYDRTLSPSINFGAVKSVWIDIDQTPTCVPAVQFVRVATGDVTGDDVVGVMDGTSNTIMFLLQKRPDDRARLSIVFDGGAGNDELRVRGSTSPCGTSASASSIKLTEVMVSSFQTKLIDLVPADLVALRSMRVKNLDSGQTWCAPLSIIAILIA